jgi:hypothetical protein
MGVQYRHALKVLLEVSEGDDFALKCIENARDVQKSIGRIFERKSLRGDEEIARGEGV